MMSDITRCSPTWFKHATSRVWILERAFLTFCIVTLIVTFDYAVSVVYQFKTVICNCEWNIVIGEVGEAR